MLKKYRKPLILTSLACLLPIAWGLLLGRDLDGIFLIPLIMLAGQWFCMGFTLLDPKNKNQNPKSMGVVLWIIPVMTNVLCAMDMALKAGTDVSVTMILCLLFALLFLAVGNYFPKVRQNYTMGIKVSWAYTSPENWNATHRFGGKVWVAAGVLLLPAAFLPEHWAITAMFLILLPATIAPIVYSYGYYRRQKARGDKLEPLPRASGKWGKAGAAITVAILIFVAACMFAGDLRYEFGDEELTVDATMYSDYVLLYADVETLKYVEGNIGGIRTWGWGSFRLLMGNFQNDELGAYTRYTYYNPESCILLTVKGKPVVLSGKDAEETRAIYQELEAHMVNWLAG